MTTLVWNWTNDGKTAASVMDAASSTLTDAQILTEVRDAYQLHLRDIQVSTTVLQSLTLLGPTPLSLAVVNAGTLSGQPSPPNSCYLVDKNAASGRRGRWFLPGLAEDDTFGTGLIGTARIAAVTAACNDFLTECNGGLVALRIERSDGVTFDPITSFTCQALIGVQRRRLGR